MGYDAVGVGDRELSGGLDGFDETVVKTGLPLTSATYTERGGDAPFLEPFVVKEHEIADGKKVRIGYLSLSTYNSTFARTGSSGRAIVHRDPADQARRYLPDLAKRADIVVLLANLSPQELQRVIQAAPGTATLAFGSFGDRISPGAFEEIGGLKTFYAGDQGKRIGEVRIFLDGGGIGEMSAHDVHLTKAYPEDPDYKKLVADAMAGVREVMRSIPPASRQASPGTVLINPEGGSASRKFLTADACLRCHEPAHRVWAHSGHARAIQTLADANQDFNPECLRCHTTGYGTPEGFLSVKATPALVNVQCEACHGNAALHVLDTSKPYGRVAPRVCFMCHTKQNSPEFSFFKYWEKIKH